MPKPKLTPEERKELRRQKKAEKKRLAALKKRQQKVDHLEREVKYGNLTIKRHEKSWREMLLKIAVPRMKEDLVYAWHNFERAIDAKDFTISLLMDEIRDSEEQYMMNLRNHVENVDRLIQMFKDQVEEFKGEAKRLVADLIRESEEEAASIEATAADGQQYLKVMLYGLEMARKNQEKKVRGDLLSRIDEEDTKCNMIIQNMKQGLEDKLLHLWDETENFISDYQSRTEGRRHAYQELREQDDGYQKVIADQLHKIKNSYELIKVLRQRYADVLRTNGVVLEDLEAERVFFAECFFRMKNALERDIKTDYENLAFISSRGRMTINDLEDVKRKGKWILCLAEICRKMETEREKILSYPIPPPFKQLGRSILEFQGEAQNDELYLFWCKVAQANAFRYSMNEEREFLKKEHKKLKRRIYRFCQCLDCPVLPPIHVKTPLHVVNLTDYFIEKYLPSSMKT